MGRIIYIWRIASNCPEDLIVSHNKSSVDPALFRSTFFIKNAEPALFSYERTLERLKGQYYIPNSAQLPLVSVEASQQLTELLRDSVQMVPAQVFCVDGVLDAVVLNPLRAVAAVDWEQSTALLIAGTKHVMKFTKLELLPKALNGIHLARLEELRSFLLVSEAIKNLFSSCALCEFGLPSKIRR